MIRNGVHSLLFTDIVAERKLLVGEEATNQRGTCIFSL